MKLKNIFFILLILSGLTSCQPKDRVYVKHKDLSPNVEWLQNDIIAFEIPIKDKDQLYKMGIAFRYANGYRFQSIDLNIIETSPSAKVQRFDFSSQVRDDSGNYIGEPGYDIWDSEHILIESREFKETGVYTYTIQHTMPVDPLNFAMEIGMILDLNNE
jgi:gliding motility-associated lipoprotein GldH